MTTPRRPRAKAPPAKKRAAPRATVTQYVALLRGINVGGKNLIKMGDLKACFEKHGLLDVVTFIQSGNVLFASPETNSPRLVEKLEKLLTAEFGYEASLVLRSKAQLREVVARAPKGFGTRPGEYRYDAVFLKEPLDSATAMKSVPLNDQVDRAWAGPGVLYFSRLIAKTSRSRLARLMSLPVYRSMTIRNWNTTTKLLGMIETR